jgi:hypothetical protein
MVDCASTILVFHSERQRNLMRIPPKLRRPPISFYLDRRSFLHFLEIRRGWPSVFTKFEQLVSHYPAQERWAEGQICVSRGRPQEQNIPNSGLESYSGQESSHFKTMEYKGQIR